MLTVSTNVVPVDDYEQRQAVDWLTAILIHIFREWSLLNGTVLKPAGSRNEDQIAFPEPHLFVKIRSVISVERGGETRQGQIHAHVLLEVAHMYRQAVNGNEGLSEDGKDVMGVHINVYALRNYLNAHIEQMGLLPERLPSKIYVNSKLLTRGTDNSNKWLTLQYINKDRAKDNDGGTRNLREDELNSEPQLQKARAGLLRAQAKTEVVNDTLDAELEAFLKEDNEPLTVKRANHSRSTKGPRKYK